MKNILFIQSQELITYNNKIIVNDGERVFTSFIGQQPAKLIIGINARVWEVIRCGARYHHDGISEDITKDNASLFFCDFHGLQVRNGYCYLYKRVRDDFTDFFSGIYKYLPGTTVTADDWIPNERIVCGNALHLSATKELSEQWNEGGHVLKCLVALENMCVFPYNISQIRCRTVRVLHAGSCHYLRSYNEDCNCGGDET